MTNTGAAAVCVLAIMCIDAAKEIGLLQFWPALIVASILFIGLGKYASKAWRQKRGRSN